MWWIETFHYLLAYGVLQSCVPKALVFWTVENDTILLCLTTRNWPIKFSLVTWIHYCEVSNYLWTPFPFLKSYTYCITLKRKMFLNLQESIFAKTLKGQRRLSRKYCSFKDYFISTGNKLRLDKHFKFLNYSEE